MKEEIEVFKKCCFCIPLRYGLLGWGYIKLAYCQSLYTCSLWVRYTQKAFNALRVLYNNGFRMLMGLPRYCSASGMFAEANIDCFRALVRKRVASLMHRVRGSPSSLLNTIVENVECPIVRHWNKIADALIMVWMTLSLVRMVGILADSTDEDELQAVLLKALALPVISLIILLADFIVTIVFIIGGHKKNPTLLSVFYYMSMVMSVQMAFKIIWFIYIMITIYFFILIFVEVIANVIGLIIQIYVIFLVRNEIIKLRNQQGNRSRYNVARGGAVLDNPRTTEEAEPL